jgi:histidinol-phosphate aminotransferase
MNMDGEKIMRVHGGTDSLGVARFDFSTNSNAYGPCPHSLQEVQQADISNYPDPDYIELRQALADFHEVDVWRIVLAASASEFIFRISALTAQTVNARGEIAKVWLPASAYGDYTYAAQAWGLRQVQDLLRAHLLWACEPSSPLGQAHSVWPEWLHQSQSRLPPFDAHLVLDCAYAPLQLQGQSSLTDAQREKVWCLWSPNKALGLTGVRASYAIAPLHADAAVQSLQRLAPSWPIGAHGVTMLHNWVQSDTQSWLTQSRSELQIWKDRQMAVLKDLGWDCLPSLANFFCARSPKRLDLMALRVAGIKLRDAVSLGLPGFYRMAVLPPAAQDALFAQLQLDARSDNVLKENSL